MTASSVCMSYVRVKVGVKVMVEIKIMKYSYSPAGKQLRYAK